MKGGYRFNAGRPSWKPQTSWAARLDVRKLAKGGWLGNGATVTWQWSNGLRATVKDCDAGIELAYRYPFSNGDQDVKAWLPVEQAPCHLGGSRPWFACPRCHRRVAIVYLWGYTACRTCHGMAYPSQSEGTLERSWRRTRKVEEALGGEWLTVGKPKWMRLATYRGLKEEAYQEEEFREMELAAFMERMGLEV